MSLAGLVAFEDVSLHVSYNPSHVGRPGSSASAIKIAISRLPVAPFTYFF